MIRAAFSSTLATLLSIATTAVLGAATRADAHGKIPVLTQVTRNTQGEVWKPVLRSEVGDSIVFVSDGDVEGPGTAPGHREVYIYDAANNAVTRVTHTTDGESYDAARETGDTHTFWPIVVAFISTGDLDPSLGNPDHNPEVFLWVSESNTFVQVTDTAPPVVNAEVYASEAGKCIVFRSNGDLDNNDGSDLNNPGNGFNNADGSDEIFNVDFNAPDFIRSDWMTTQVSNGPAGTTSSHPAVGGYIYARQCRSNVYQSDHDQLGNGSSGTHVYNFTEGSGLIEQLSEPGPGSNLSPTISSASSFARGPFVVYQSDMDPISNGSAGFEIFRFRLFKNELWQYTFASGDSGEPAISDGGGRLTFESKAELFLPDKPVRSGEMPPFNSDGNSEIFVTNRKTQIAQITRTQGCESTDPTIRDTGDTVAFRSTCNLIGNLNPNGVAQVFYYLLVKNDDPRSTAAGCQIADGCCNEANGCFHPLLGRKQLPPRVAIRPDYSN